MRMFAIKLILFICVFSLFFGTSSTSPPESLRQVNVLYRHGDRSPVSTYPLDINNGSDVWPDGFGWLTNIGKMQQYELGQYLRKRYDGFLNTSRYTHEEISIRSSGVERCLMSAYSNLAGLFPPQGDQEWNPNIPWQPIPVQTTPIQIDNILAEGALCPRYNQLLLEVMNSPPIKKEEEDNKDFYAMVEKNTGVPQESIADIWRVIDTLTCEKAHNLTVNDWVSDQVWNKLVSLISLNFGIQFANIEMARLKGGPLLKEIISNLDSYTSLPKFYMYSAHDTTVASLLSALKVFNNHQPMYRALVIIELHEINNVSEVKVFYKNDTTQEPYELTIPGCDSPCTLQKFKDANKDSIPGNWTVECEAKTKIVLSTSTDLTPASWIALAIGIGLGSTIVIAIIVMIVNLRKKRSANYTKI